jgi:hypothetical protein
MKQIRDTEAVQSHTFIVVFILSSIKYLIR